MKLKPTTLIACSCLLSAMALGDPAPIVDYDWTTQPVSSYQNFSRSWTAGTTVSLTLPFDGSASLAPTVGYDGPDFLGGGSLNVTGTTDGTTPGSFEASQARVGNNAAGDELSVNGRTVEVTTGGELVMNAAMLYLFPFPGPTQIGDTSLRYVNGNKSNIARFQWVIRDNQGIYYVSDMAIQLISTETESVSNNLTSRRWAVLDTTSEDLTAAVGDYLFPSDHNLDFTTITGAGVFVTQANTLTDSGKATFYATVREFEAYPYSPEREDRLLSSYYFGNSLTGSTYPAGHGALGTSAGKDWTAVAKLGAGWQLWQHRYELYVGADLGGVANGDYTLDPNQQGDSASLLDTFINQPWEVMVMQAFGNVLWNEIVPAGGEKFSIVFDEETNVGDPQSADDLMAAYLALNPEGKVFLYTNWHGMPHGIVPPIEDWPAWTQTYAKANELVPGETSNEFPDRDAFVYDDLFFEFYQVENPPWDNDRNWTRDYHNKLFEELRTRYPTLWSEGRFGAIPTGEVFRALDQIYQAGGDPEFGNPTVPEKIVRIADFYADSLHVKGGMAQFTCAATFYAAMYNEHPGVLDWSIYNDPANWGDDPTHDATPLLLITQARAEQVCDVIWDILTSHPYALQRIAPFHGKDVTAPAMASIWGSNSHGQIGREEITGDQTAPVALEDDITVFLGTNTAYMLDASGEVLGAGQNHRGQLGDATLVNRRYPYELTLLPAATMIDAGLDHAAAVTTTGDVYAWGSNNHGQLGDDYGRFGDTMNGQPLPPENARPRAVAGVTGATQVACGNGFTLALLSNGTVLAWGRDNVGQLGDGTPDVTGVATPTAITGLSSIVEIGAGTDFAVALSSDGTVYTWGGNASGQLGQGDTTDRATPTAISTLSSIAMIAVGDAHVLAVDSTGSLYAWGSNSEGQLGMDPVTDPLRTSPVARGFGTNIAAIAAGRAHSLLLEAAGTVSAWGANNKGQLGIGSTTPTTLPQTVPGLSNVISIAAGGDQSAAKVAGIAAANATPTLALTAPTSATEGTPVVVSLTAADTDGSVLSVDILLDGQVLNNATPVSGDNWTYTWYNATPGTYSLQAQATDNDGATGLSNLASITIDVAPDPDPDPDPEPDPGSGENPVADPGFDLAFTDTSSWAHSDNAVDVSDAWLVHASNTKWTLNAAGYAEVLTNSGASGIVQILQDNKQTTGLQNFRFELANQSPGNTVECYVWGVNEEFGISLYENRGPRRRSDINVDLTNGLDGAVLLADTTLGNLDYPTLTAINYDNVSEPTDHRLDFGAGYDYIVVYFFVQGVTTGEYVQVDNVEIGGSSPGNPVADEAFELGLWDTSSWAYSDDADDLANAWLSGGSSGAWTYNASGYAEVTSGGIPSMVQVIVDNKQTTGLQNFKFDLANQLPGNAIECYIWGVNEEFGLNLYETRGPRRRSDLSIDVTNGLNGAQLLADTTLGSLDLPNLSPVSYDGANQVDFGTGYDFLVVHFFVQGVTSGEYVQVDNVIIGGVAPDDPAPEPEPGAATLTFDDVASAPSAASISTTDANAIVWTFSALDGREMEINTLLNGATMAAKGNGTEFTFGRSDGAVFDLLRMEVFNQLWAVKTYTLTPTLADGTTGTPVTVSLDKRASATVELNWTGITSVMVDNAAGNGRLAVDDVVVDYVLP